MLQAIASISIASKDNSYPDYGTFR